MVQRHLTFPHRFICFTDNTNQLDKRIEIRRLPDNPQIQGWWWKPYLFKDDHFDKGDTILFFDLDTVIIKNINNIVEYLPGHFLGLQDVGRALRPGLLKLGSAIMRWQSGQYSNIWTDLEKNFTVTRKYQGDQDWIWQKHQNSIVFFPELWIRSYKWEIRNRHELTNVGSKSNFISIENNPTVPNDTSIFVFHGHPMIHIVQDPIIVDNWI
jgi:hypothetical protein